MDLKAILDSGTIVALPDNHTEETARRKAVELLESGKVKIFFIEYQCYVPLNGAISELLDTRATSEAALNALEPYFTELNKGDAEPSLLQLTAAAIGNGIQVLACDAKYQDVREDLEKAGESSIAPLFSGMGLAFRDRRAAEMIANYLHSSPQLATGRLMLWGANHFTENTQTEKYPDDRLQVLLMQKGLEVHVAEEMEMA